LDNRESKDGIANQHDVNNALIKSHEETRVYDDAGNLKELKSKEGTLTFAYDPLDRLTTLEKKGQWQKHYVYDAFNRRLYEEKFNWNAESNKWQSQGKKNFIYSEQKEIGSFGKNKELKSFRGIDPTKESEHGSAFLFELEGKSYVPFYDHRGSVTSQVLVVKGIRSFFFSA
jgi:YD repeat-containing protein